MTLALGLGALGASGLCIDVVRRALDPSAPQVRWPFGLVPPTGTSTLSILAVIAGIALALAAARAAIAYGTAILVGRLIHLDIVPALRRRVFDKLLRLDLRFFDRSASGSIINRVTGDVQSVRSFVDGVLLQGAVLILTLAVYVAYMVRVHAGLTAACLAPTPVILFATVRFSRWARPAYEKSRALADDMVLAFTEGVKGIRVTKTFGTEAHADARFRARNRAVRDQQEEIFRRVSRLGPTVSFVTALDVAVLLLYGGALVARGAVTLGQLVVFAGLLQQFAAQVSATATILNTLEQSLIAARRVFEVLDAPVAVATPAVPVKLAPTASAITFEGVELAHTPGALVLRGVDLTVAAGRVPGADRRHGGGEDHVAQSGVAVLRPHRRTRDPRRHRLARRRRRRASPARRGRVSRDVPVSGDHRREHCLRASRRPAGGHRAGGPGGRRPSPSSPSSPSGTTRRSRRVGSTFRADSGSGWPSRAPCFSTHLSCCSTIRRAPSMPKRRMRFCPPSSRPVGGEPRCWWRTGCGRCARPTGSPSCTAAGSSSKAVTRRWWRWAAGTRVPPLSTSSSASPGSGRR